MFCQPLRNAGIGSSFDLGLLDIELSTSDRPHTLCSTLVQSFWIDRPRICLWADGALPADFRLLHVPGTA